MPVNTCCKSFLDLANVVKLLLADKDKQTTVTLFRRVASGGGQLTLGSKAKTQTLQGAVRDDGADGANSKVFTGLGFSYQNRYENVIIICC